MSLYKISKAFMIGAGIWKIPLTQKPWVQKVYGVYSITVQSIFVLNIISMIFRIFQMTGKEDLETIYVNITLVILVIEITYKVLIYLKNGIPYMFLNVIEREYIINSLNNSSMIKQIYLKEVIYYKWAIFAQTICVGSGIVWFITVNVYKKYIKTLAPGEHFMYEIWFPFNEAKHDSVVTCYNIVIALYGFCFSCASSTPLQSLMVFAISQLKILQFKFKSAFAQTDDDLKQLIEEHQFLIQFVEDLNRGVKWILFLDYVLESVNGAGALLQLVSIKDPIEIPYCLLFIVNVVVTMCFTAWSANEVKEQSMNIASALYESKWYSQNNSVKKLVHIIIMRAQKPLKMEIGRFLSMDTEVTLTAFKGMYSYATFMRNVRSRDD